MDDANNDDDPLAEVRRIRFELGARFGFDPRLIHEDAVRRQYSWGQVVVDLSRARREISTPK